MAAQFDAEHTSDVVVAVSLGQAFHRADEQRELGVCQGVSSRVNQSLLNTRPTRPAVRTGTRRRCPLSLRWTVRRIAIDATPRSCDDRGEGGTPLAVRRQDGGEIE